MLLRPAHQTIGETTMSVKTEMLGGRLPLLDPQALSIWQKEIYDRLNTTMIPWADGAHVQSKTDDGGLIVVLGLPPYEHKARSPTSTRRRRQGSRPGGLGAAEHAFGQQGLVDII